MLFWIIALLLAAITAATLVRAMLGGRDGAVSAAAYDLRVYRDQLREVEKDVARGLLSEADAARTRLDISRRVLEADRTLADGALADGSVERSAPRAANMVAVGLAGLAVVAGAAWLYGQLGAPGYPDLPLKARYAMAEEARELRASQAEAEARPSARALAADTDPAYLDLVARLRAAVAERPGDAQGLELLARHEAALGDFVAAHNAQSRLIAAKGEAATADDYATLSDLMIVAAGGQVSPEAETALSEALTLDPRNGPARYYSGLLFIQTGRPDLAFRFWRALLLDGPPDAPWTLAARAGIEEVAALAGQHNFVLPPEVAPRGPSAADIDAAGAMSADERTEMIRGMVAGLAERLATEGGPATEWARLIRAYGVLGEAEKVAPIVAEARQVFAGDAAALAEIDAAARDAGIAP